MSDAPENVVPEQPKVIPAVERKVFNSGPFSYRTLPTANSFRPDSPLLPSSAENRQPDAEPEPRPQSDLHCNSNSDSLNLFAAESLSNLSNPGGSGGSDKDPNVEQRPPTAAGTPTDGKPVPRKRKNPADAKPGTLKYSRADRKIADFMTKLQSSPKHSAVRSLSESHSSTHSGAAEITPEQSTAAATLISNLTEIAAIESRAAESTSAIREREYKKELERRSRTIDTLQDQLRLAEHRHQDQLRQQREIIRQLLIQQSLVERKAARVRNATDQLRLGHFKPCRVGDHFEDKWQEGEAFQENARLLEQISRLIEEKTRRKRKPAVKRSLSEPSSSTDPSDDLFHPPDDPDEYKILKQLTEKLRDNEKELLMEREKLERERNLHIREMKRIQCEDQSRFKNHEALPLENKRYLLISLLGKGGFSEVWRAYDLDKNIYVACKIHHVNKEWKEEKKANYVKHAMREKDIHISLRHPRIVRLLDVFYIDNDSFCTVLEHCDGNDLDFYLKQQKQLSEKDAKLVIRQVLTALRYLSEQRPPIIHYDLKPANILMQSSLPGCPSLSENIKITDFGLSKRMETSDDGESIELTSQGAGTYWYLPPEAFQRYGQVKISSKVDVWSVGVIFYQCLFGKKPFGHNQTQQEILQQSTILNASEVEFPTNPKISAAAQDFIRRCLQHRKEDRADVVDLLNHELFKRN